MGSDTLSRGDLERLLAGHSSITPRASAALDLSVYDWRRPHRISRDQLRTVEAMYERMVSNLESWLTARVRGELSVKLQSVEQFSFGEFTLSLPTPCSSFIFDIDATGQRGVVDFGPEFSYYIVDKLFGGEGKANVYYRTLTPIERMAIRGVADKILLLLQQAWKDHVPMEFTIDGFESSPEVLQVVNREDPVLVANIEFTAGESTSFILVCLPFAVLDKFCNASEIQRTSTVQVADGERDSARHQSESALRSTKVPLFARLPEFHLSMRELARLEVGTVLPTGISKDARVIVRAGTQERFIGHPGRVAGNLAVRVLEAVPSSSCSHD